MKIFAIVLFAAVAVAGSSANNEVCFKSLSKVCGNDIETAAGSLQCHAKLPHFEHAIDLLSQFANQQIETSYKYMMLAAQFNSFVKDRPGFHAHIKALSDRSWEAGQNLIQYITKRGGTFTFRTQNQNMSMEDVNEFQALASVLDNEKYLFDAARHVHLKVFHAKIHQQDSYDPEVGHYIEEHYLTSLADSIRKYSGLANDLNNLYTQSKDINMDNYLFDQYLQKA